MKLISIDAETNGLRGQAFAIGAIATDDEGSELERLVLRCTLTGPVDPWVAENVLPGLHGLTPTHDSYYDMLGAFRDFLGDHEGYLLAHVTWPVEARLLLDTYREAGGPFPLIDVSGALLAQGHDPTSVDAYLAERGLSVEAEFGTPHHPLYDAVAAERAFRQLMLEGER